MQWDKKWAICECRAAWWWIETLEIVLAAVDKALTLVLFWVLVMLLVYYYSIKIQRIILPS